MAKILGTSERIEMFLVRSADQKDASWLIVSNMVPVASITLSDQDQGDRIASYFISDEYKSAILGAAQKITWERALRGAKARLISNGNIVQAAGESPEEIKRRTIREFSQAADLVVKAMSKNVIDPNPLKAALYDVFEARGMKNPEVAVEEVFDKGGEELVHGLVTQAFEWMNLSKESRDQLTSMIGGDKVGKKNVVATSDEDDDETDDNLSARLAANSLPLTTVGNQPAAQDYRSNIRRAFS